MHAICRSLYPTCTLQSETAGNISSVGFLSLLTSPFYVSPGLNNIKSVFIVDALIQDLTWDQFLSLILTRFFSVFSNYEVSEKWRRNCGKLSVTSLKVIWVSDASAYLLFLSTGYPFTLTMNAIFGLILGCVTYADCAFDGNVLSWWYYIMVKGILK